MAPTVMVLTSPSPSLALLGGSRGLEEEMEGILPGFGEALARLEEVKGRFYRPLLTVRPRELEHRLTQTLAAFTFHLVSASFPFKAPHGIPGRG